MLKIFWEVTNEDQRRLPKCRKYAFWKCWSWKDLFGISVDHDVFNKPAVSELRVRCYPECVNSPCPLDTSQVSRRADLDTAQKDPAQLLLLILLIFLQWGRNTNYLDKQIYSLEIRNFGKAKLNIIFPIFVYVESAVETAHMQGRDKKAHAHKNKKVI